MDDGVFPGDDILGVQLGVGVQGPSVYKPDGDDGDGKRWLHAWADGAGILDGQLAFVSGPTELEATKEDVERVDEEHMHEESSEEELIAKMAWGTLPSALSDIHYGGKSEYDVRQVAPLAPAEYIPQELLEELESNKDKKATRTSTIPKKPLRNEIVVDPTLGDLFAVGSVMIAYSKRPSKIIAFTTGSGQSILAVSLLLSEIESFQLVDQDNQDFTSRCDAYRVTNPEKLWKFDVGTKIKSIKISRRSEFVSTFNDLVGVLTDTSFHLFELIIIDKVSNKLDFQTFQPLRLSSFGDFRFADFTFNPSKISQFAIVDVRGNWAVGQIPVRGKELTISKEYRGTVFDPEDISDWKKIEWSSSMAKIIVLARCSGYEIDIIEKWQIELIQAKTWSYIQDYKVLNDSYHFLLTSREIIVLRMTIEGQIIRQLSWKHDLDPEDSTHRLLLGSASLGDTQVVCATIMSRKSALIYIQKFLIGQGEHIQAIKDYEILEIPGCVDGVEHSSFLNEPATYTDTEQDGTLPLWFNFFVKNGECGALQHYLLSTGRTRHPKSPKHVHFDSSLANDTQSQLSMSSQVEAHVHRLIRKTNELNMGRFQDKFSNDYEVLQKYGYRLSEAMNSYLESRHRSGNFTVATQSYLKNLTQVPSNNVESLEEYDSLLQQFFEYYQDHNIDFTKITTISKLLLQEDIGNIDIFFNKLLQCWALLSKEPELLTRQVVEGFFWSVLRFYEESKIKKLAAQTQESLSPAFADIFAAWDEGGSDDGLGTPMPSFESQDTNPARLQAATQTTAIPTIKSSQAHSQSQRKTRIAKAPHYASQNSSLLPENMTPAFTLLQPSVPPLSSQLSSSSQGAKKKKKKKVGGFG